MSAPLIAAERQKLHGHVPAVAARLAPVDSLPGSQRLNLAISLPLRNQQSLTDLLRQIYDPASPNYRKYLTPAEFTEKFGPSGKDYQAVIDFARAHGLTITGRHPNRVILDVQGAVPDIEKALNVKMRVYKHPREDRKFYAPDADPSLDLAVPVLHISGLDNYSTPRPNLAPKPAVQKGNAQPSSGSGPGGTYAGADFRAAYVPGVSLNGNGQSIGLLEFDGYYTSDITAYKNQFGLPDTQLVNVSVDGGVSSPGSWNSEVALDIEMAISMAPGISTIYVYEAPNSTGQWIDLLNRMANDNLSKQLSCSWYSLSIQAYPAAEQVFQQMAAQGQSFFNASGDEDAFTETITFPGDSPNITQVGGTTLSTTGPGGSYVSETVWNWGYNSNTQSYWGSSGGISANYTIPTYQQGVNMSGNQGSTTMRNIPDVALTADNICVRYNNGATGNFGGTSCAAPLWAAFIALVNQQAAARGLPAVGFLNPTIYAIGKSGSYGSILHDTTTGNNFWPNSPSKFAATSGYDLCTGWGTPAGLALINALAGAPIITSSLSVTGTNATTFTYQIAATGSPTSYEATGLPSGLTLNPATGLISGTPTVTGTSSVSISASNAYGTGNAVLTIAIVAPPPPVITSVLTATGTNGMAFSYQIAATNNPTTYGASGLPTGLTVSSSNGIISGTPTAVGTFNSTISASNAGGTDSETLVITVVPPPAPVISGSLAVTGTMSVAFSYQITAINNPTGYNATGLPSGLTVNTSSGLVSGTPTVTGSFAPTISASNAFGTDSETLLIMVVPPPPPVINSLLNATGTNGFAFSYHITATYSPTSYGASGLPAGFSVDSATGVISGTPAGTGTFNTSISAINMSGTGSATLVIRILQTPAPVIGNVLSLCSFSGTGGAFRGASPGTVLTQGNDGNIYGATSTGGSGNDGTVFQITPSGSVTTLCSFTGTNGASLGLGPRVLTWGSDGNLYGTTSGGGNGNRGTVFRITPGGLLTTLCTFTGTSGTAPGMTPQSFLVQGSDGNFYGTTNSGGSGNFGTAFRITPSGSLTALGSFTGTTGARPGNAPQSALVQGSDGSFYGTTNTGGSNNFGTVFRITPSGTLTTLGAFTGTSGANPGNAPQSSLVQGSDGSFYGTTNSGGSSNFGTVFRITPGGTLTTLCSFTGTNGASPGNMPQSTLVEGSDGNFYGTTNSGGSGNRGTVFQITPSGVLTSLLAFNNTNGASPVGSLRQGSDGYFYGTTNIGGTPGRGTVFKITSGGILTTLGSFTGTNGVPLGTNPQGALLQGNDGYFYGTTNTGGSSNLGTVFKLSERFFITGTSKPFAYQIVATNNPASYGAAGLPAGLGVNPATGLISGIPVETGSFDGSISATNAGGTGSATLKIVVMPGPEITSIPSATGTNGAAFSYQITATNNPTSFGASGLPAGLAVNMATGLISGTTTATGTTSVTLTASNDYGTGSANLIIVVLPLPPAITSGTTAAGTQGQTFSYQITATNNPTSFGASGLPVGLAVDTNSGLISGIPGVYGTSNVSISAGNDGGTGSATLVITVLQSPPVISSGTTVTAIQGQAFTYQIAATSNAVSYDADGLPPGLSVDTLTGIISGTATTTGTSHVTISASNPGGTGSATLMLTVVTPLPPAITSAAVVTGTCGVAFNYQISATNNPTSYGVNGLPAGLGIDTATGSITGTPMVSGTSNVIISANNAGGTGSENLTIIMQQAPPGVPVSPIWAAFVAFLLLLLTGVFFLSKGRNFVK